MKVYLVMGSGTFNNCDVGRDEEAIIKIFLSEEKANAFCKECEEDEQAKNKYGSCEYFDNYEYYVTECEVEE